MKAQAAIVFAGFGLVLAGCASPLGKPGQPPPAPPPSAEQDRSGYNNQQVALFLSRDPGWQAWLNAAFLSQRAVDNLADASKLNTPVWKIIDGISVAQTFYRTATSFQLMPFTVTSSCRNRYPEANGAVQLSDGLIAHYGSFTTKWEYFDNGTSCLVSVGLVDEIDASRGLPVMTARSGQPINWDGSFSHNLVWHQPYWTISTGTRLSLPDMVDLIEQ